MPKEMRADWLANYEIVENKQFLKAVEEGGNIGELRLRLGIILMETGEFIGWCCSGIKSELPEPNREIMFALSNKYTNRGYATQAAQGITKYLFENTDVQELCAVALIRNSTLYFKVADIDKYFEHYKNIGVDFIGTPHLVADMGSYELWMVFFKDTEDNLLALMSNKPKA